MAATGFTLSIYPWIYIAQAENSGWKEEFQEKPHKTPAEEAAMDEAELNELLAQRNSFPDLPLVNYTSQYGMGCFEGMKAFPQKDGSLKLFRPDENAKRFRKSMEGLKMPGFPEDTFVQAVREIVRRNRELGFAPEYDAAWEAGDFADGHAVYIRPFSYSEPAIGLGLSTRPWVVMVSTPVGSYFRPRQQQGGYHRQGTGIPRRHRLDKMRCQLRCTDSCQKRGGNQGLYGGHFPGCGTPGVC